MPPRELFNESGESFDQDFVDLGIDFAGMDNQRRRDYRDRNASFIANHDAKRILIVAGPGSGKSFLFLERIRHWLSKDNAAQIYVSSFVRRLVNDLRKEVTTKIEEPDAGKVTISTLHGLARSIIERNHGSAEHRRGTHINVVSEQWTKMVWSDVLAFHSGIGSNHKSDVFFEMFNTEVFDTSDMWPEILETYETLSAFYNSVGFSDMIAFARQSVDERPELVEQQYWIIDEFQDFNVSEDHLIRSLTVKSLGVLIAGDDEQALYQDLKQSMPEIIVSYYESGEFSNAMLPFCSRCSYWVCLAASAFTATQRTEQSIAKIYLPLRVDEDEPKVQLVATPTPASEVDYIKWFIEQNQDEFDAHVAKMQAGEETDPFLLILTPDKSLRMLKPGADLELRTWLARWSTISPGRSADYRRIQAYCAAAGVGADNYVLRRVLSYEGVTVQQVHTLLKSAQELGCNLNEVESDLLLAIGSKCRDVSGLLDRTDKDWAEKVSELAKTIGVENSPSLVNELEIAPISAGIFAIEDEAEEIIETAGATAAVELMTLVGSKGLSAQNVIIIGCDDVNLGYTSRLAFFVAMTRARNSLHLITSLKSRGSQSAHQYLSQIPDDYCQFLLYKKTGRELSDVRDRRAWDRQIANWVPRRR